MTTELEWVLESLGIKVVANQIDQALRYLCLLQRWNRAQRLTGVESLIQMVYRHIADSLVVIPLIGGSRMVDVGSGAGLPGVPLAIFLPEVSVSLLDARAKRCHFLFQVKTELKLHNIDVIHGRAEEYRPTVAYPCVISRAFAPLREFAVKAGHLCTEDGHLLAMKGRLATHEIDDVKMPYNVRASHRLVVPGLQAERHVVELVRQLETVPDRERL